MYVRSIWICSWSNTIFFFVAEQIDPYAYLNIIQFLKYFYISQKSIFLVQSVHVNVFFDTDLVSPPDLTFILSSGLIFLSIYFRLAFGGKLSRVRKRILYWMKKLLKRKKIKQLHTKRLK